MFLELVLEPAHSADEAVDPLFVDLHEESVVLGQAPHDRRELAILRVDERRDLLEILNHQRLERRYIGGLSLEEIQRVSRRTSCILGTFDVTVEVIDVETNQKFGNGERRVDLVWLAVETNLHDQTSSSPSAGRAVAWQGHGRLQVKAKPLTCRIL